MLSTQNSEEVGIRGIAMRGKVPVTEGTARLGMSFLPSVHDSLKGPTNVPPPTPLHCTCLHFCPQLSHS